MPDLNFAFPQELIWGKKAEENFSDEDDDRGLKVNFF